MPNYFRPLECPRALDGAQHRMHLGLRFGNFRQEVWTDRDLLRLQAAQININARQTSIEPLLGMPKHEVVLRRSWINVARNSQLRLGVWRSIPVGLVAEATCRFSAVTPPATAVTPCESGRRSAGEKQRTRERAPRRKQFADTQETVNSWAEGTLAASVSACAHGIKSSPDGS